jgi:fructose-1,6-bisphosphatase I/sedoheptulose-1,7-bisphosphatase
MRWVASLVAETHRILTRGGVFLDPWDSKDPTKEGRPRLLNEASPIAFLIEQAGGLASTGRQRVLDVIPTALHQRIPFIFGCREEVERINRYHTELPGDHDENWNPLYGSRGLFHAIT